MSAFQLPLLGSTINPMSRGKTAIKSIGTYLLGGTKISLSTLQAISAVVPVPWLQSVVGAAIQVITVAEVCCVIP